MKYTLKEAIEQAMYMIQQSVPEIVEQLKKWLEEKPIDHGISFNQVFDILEDNNLHDLNKILRCINRGDYESAKALIQIFDAPGPRDWNKEMAIYFLGYPEQIKLTFEKEKRLPVALMLYDELGIKTPVVDKVRKELEGEEIGKIGEQKVVEPKGGSMEKLGARKLKDWQKSLKKQNAPAKVIRQFTKIWESAIDKGYGDEYAARAAIDKLPKKFLEEPTPKHGPKKTGPLAKSRPKKSSEEDVVDRLEKVEKITADLTQFQTTVKDWRTQRPTQYVTTFEQTRGIVEGKGLSEYYDHFRKTLAYKQYQELIANALS